MNKIVLTTALILAAGVSMKAQNGETEPVTLGFKGGVPVTQMFDANNTGFLGDSTSNSPFSATVPRYILGASAEFHLYRKLRFEVDGLYKRGGFEGSLFSPAGAPYYQATKFNWWEVPALLKTNVSLGHVRPFVDFGASLRHISTLGESTYSAGIPGGFDLTDNSIALHNRNSFGGVGGIGVTFKYGPVHIAPELRYTRWANQAFTYPGLSTNLNQVDFLVGFTF